MSNTNTKTPAKGKSTRPAKSATKNAITESIEAALAKAIRKTVTLGQLALTELNARKKKSSPASIEGLAATIRSTGLLMNLVVFEMDDGLFGVAAGERRTLALRWLQGQENEADKTTPDGIVSADYPVEVLIVSKDMARIISLMENSQREQMHPADQLFAFREMSAEGRTPAQISGMLGYSTRHVQKCLRLATMAPTLLDALADDLITLDQLQALSVTDDHRRQCDVWENAPSWGKNPRNLREAALEGEVSAKDNAQLAFVGRDVYEAEGGTFKLDLFTDEGFLSEPALLERLSREKLQALAQTVAADEGWCWAEGRISPLKTWGEDAALYQIQAEPQPDFTDDEHAEIVRLKARLSELEDKFDAADGDTDTDALMAECNAIESDIERITEQAIVRAWSQEARSSGGVVVSLSNGEPMIQRGILLRESTASTSSDDDNDGKPATPPASTPETKEKGLSAALITCLSSERTLAVMGALVQNTTVALALHTHTMAVKVFGSRYAGSILKTDLTPKRAELLTKSPVAEGSRADRLLGELHAQWEAKLPQGDWHDDFSWLLAWEQAEVLALLTYCIGQSLDGIQMWAARDGKVGGELTSLEHALDFNLQDWWQPTKANYFGRISKEQMSDALVDAGKVAQAASVLKMKKGDAAQLAEDELTGTGWVPACLLPDVDTDTTDETAHSDNVAA